MMQSSSDASAPSPNAPNAGSEKVSPDNRRGFLTQAAAVVLGGLLGLFPLVLGLRVFLDPLRQKKNKGGETELFTRVATLDEVPEGGPPKRFIVLAQRTDAWNRYPIDSVGAVYLTRKAGENQPTAFTDVCPHLGCSVTFRPKENDFYCPCHESAFYLDGKRANETPPRGLDDLKVEIRNDSEIWVEFKKFRVGTKEQIEIS